MPDLIEQVAPDLLRLSFGPVQDGVNIYVIGDVLVDSGPSWQGEKLLGALEGRPVTAHAITHAHFDHQGRRCGFLSGAVKAIARLWSRAIPPRFFRNREARHFALPGCSQGPPTPWRDLSGRATRLAASR
jgi:hypothetical protein